MDVDRLDALLQLILAVAGEQDDARERELGPIHLVKYAYLADLAFAELNGGETFTGTDWNFHHFGPWSPSLYARIDPALEAVHAQKKTISSPRYDDFVRYSLQDERLLRKLDASLPSIVVSAVRHGVREFGSDTGGLLRHVYVTRPMLHAAPGEMLVFEPSPPYEPSVEPEQTESKLSRKAKKEMRERFVRRRDEIRAQLLERAKKASTLVSPPPRYDDVYFDGLKILDEMAGPAPAPLEAEAVFSSDIWKSAARRDPDVS